MRAQADGFALLAVLCCLTSLGVLAASFSFGARTEMRQARWSLERSRAYYTARAGLHRTAALLREHAQDPFHAANAPWWSAESLYKDVPFGESRYSIEHDGAYGVDDEESRLNVNQATPEMLMQFPGVSTSLAEAITLFVAQKKEAESAEAAQSQSIGAGPPPEASKNVTQPIRNLAELLAVPGVTTQLLYGGQPGAPLPDGLASALTCFSSGKVNVNTARAPVLQALGLSEEQCNTLLALRAEQFPGFASVEEFQRAITGQSEKPNSNGMLQRNMKLLDVRSANFRATCTVISSRGGLDARIRARISLGEAVLYFSLFQASTAPEAG